MRAARQRSNCRATRIFLPLGKGGTVYLFGPSETKLPAWFTQYQWGLNIRFASTRLFADEASVGLTTRDMGAILDQGFGA